MCKKVLFVATVTGHINAFHIPYLKMFKENVYEVHVASKGNQKIPYCDKHYDLQFKRFPLKKENYKVYKELKKIIEKNDYEIVHCHTPVGGVLTRLAARKRGNTKVIYTAHGFHFYNGAPVWNWLLFYPIEWYLAKYTDTLITINSEDYERAKRKFGNRCKDIQYIPGVGINIKRFNINMSKEKKKMYKESIGLNENDFVLTCIARLDRNKNQGFLIKCMKELIKENKNIHLLLVGIDELNGHYQQMTIKNGLEKNIHFLGNRDDIPELLEISNIVVSSSKREGLPINIIEAFASGKPVVALKCRGVNDLVINSENGYIVQDKNIESFCDTLKELIKRNDKISKNNKEKSNSYCLKNIEDLMKKIYFGIDYRK